MKQEIIKELLKQNSKIRVVFATSTLSMGVHMPYITRIIHISPPASLEEYVQEVGKAWRSGLQSYAYCTIVTQISQIIDQKRAILQNQ